MKGCRRILAKLCLRQFDLNLAPLFLNPSLKNLSCSTRLKTRVWGQYICLYAGEKRGANAKAIRNGSRRGLLHRVGWINSRMCFAVFFPLTMLTFAVTGSENEPERVLGHQFISCHWLIGSTDG